MHWGLVKLDDNSGKFKKALKHFHANSPITPNDFGVVVKILDTDTVPQAFKVLFDKHLQSAPVVSHKDGKLIGLLYLSDLIDLIVETFTGAELERFSHDTLAKRDTIQHMNVQFLLEGRKGREEVGVLSPDNTLWDAAVMLAANGEHRVVVVDEKGEPVTVITQSRLLKLADVMFDAIPVNYKTLEETKLASKDKVTAVRDTAPVRDAFAAMKKARVSSVAVVDKDGKIVGVISHSDVKVFGYDLAMFGRLAGDCAHFLDHLRTFDANRTIAPKDDPVVLKESAHVGDALKLFNLLNIHRVFVVNEERKPIGVVSMSDVLKLIVDNEPKHHN